MTEYEMAYLNNEFVNTGMMFVSTQFSILSAFVVASYLAAHRLTQLMCGFVVAAFVWASIILSLSFYRSIVDFIGLRHEIFVAAKEGKGLAWHSAAQFDIAAAPSLISSAAFVPVIWGTLTLGAVWFFFHCRRVNMKTATAAPGAPVSTGSATGTV